MRDTSSAVVFSLERSEIVEQPLACGHDPSIGEQRVSRTFDA